MHHLNWRPILANVTGDVHALASISVGMELYGLDGAFAEAEAVCSLSVMY